MSKKYSIIDLQGTEWWAYTLEYPISKAKIRNIFKGYPEYEDLVQNEHITNKDFTLDFIQEVWDCEIKLATRGAKHGKA